MSRPRPSWQRGENGREIKRKLAARRGSRCLYCNITFEDPATATLDHFVPVVRWPRGRDKKRNWVLACGPCNLRKADALPWALVWLLLSLDLEASAVELGMAA